MASHVADMEARLLAFANGSRGSVSLPMLQAPPWQGMPDGRTDYFCADCPPGAPIGVNGSWCVHEILAPAPALDLALAFG